MDNEAHLIREKRLAKNKKRLFLWDRSKWKKRRLFLWDRESI